jgi:hypothetical protein
MSTASTTGASPSATLAPCERCDSRDAREAEFCARRCDEAQAEILSLLRDEGMSERAIHRVAARLCTVRAWSFERGAYAIRSMLAGVLS